LLISGTASEIVLVNRDKTRAEGHVYDLRDAAVFSRTTRVVAGDFSDCCLADVVIIAAGPSPGAGMKSRLDDLKESASILKSIVEDVARHNPCGILSSHQIRWMF
jgi:L-lactate dehydrogenase